MSERGSSLLETSAALGIAGLLVYGSAQAALQVTRTLATVERREDMLAAARNLLEAARGAPCAPPSTCPPGLRCSLRELAAGSSVELRAEVSSQAGRGSDDRDTVVLTTITSPPAGCL